jgi:uncharacterized protein (DUF58 family)
MKLRLTGLWLLFGPILGCMWLAAINYSNNLVYAVLYLIGSLTFVSIFHTWRNLAALEIDHFRVHSAFSGDQVKIEIYLRNPGLRPVYGLTFSRLEESWRRPMPMPQQSVPRIDPGETRAVELSFPVDLRGKYWLSAVLIRSSYPLGLVYAAKKLPIETDYYVYPAPHGVATLPKLQLHGEQGISTGSVPGDDFAGVRLYAQGESLRHVDWKAYARGRPLSVKQFTGEYERELCFDETDLTHLQLEERLSQLSLWVVMAEKEHLPFVLRVGDSALPRGSGHDHARRALQILAVAGTF